MARPGAIGGKRKASGRHVLVVDREEAICQLIQEVLEDVSFAVSCAATVAEARKLLRRRRRFAIAFIAVRLPDEDGEALAADAAARATAVVLMSGHPDGIERGRASGFPFLAKPFRAKDILRLAIESAGG
jgi:DNA-binding NtrC family response regulator